MSNHNLFTLGADGAVVPASSETILIAARQVLAHRVRRDAWLQSPQKTGEYLTARLGHLDYEVFGLMLLDKRHRVIECVDLFRGTIAGTSVHPREVGECQFLRRIRDQAGVGPAVRLENRPARQP
jgi:DNA repair protein RadC